MNYINMVNFSLNMALFNWKNPGTFCAFFVGFDESRILTGLFAECLRESRGLDHLHVQFFAQQKSPVQFLGTSMDINRKKVDPKNPFDAGGALCSGWRGAREKNCVAYLRKLHQNLREVMLKIEAKIGRII